MQITDLYTQCERSWLRFSCSYLTLENWKNTGYKTSLHSIAGAGSCLVSQLFQQLNEPLYLHQQIKVLFLSYICIEDWEKEYFKFQYYFFTFPITSAAAILCIFCKDWEPLAEKYL